MKKAIAFLISAALLLCGCAFHADEDELIVVGFSQVGSESSWRIANTRSMTETFSEQNGFELIYDDAKNKQQNQYDAIREFIQQEVDYIVLAPITETGWDGILTEAKNAGIPVIIVDRSVSVADDSLYTCKVGSDFLEEGAKAARWLESELESRGKKDVRILHLQGTRGSTSQLMRTKGLETAVAANPDWEIAAQFECDYTEAMGYEVTRDYLEKDKNINVIFSENDNMSFGAMRAMDEAGITYGKDGDVIVISFDAVRSALTECLKGNINLCVECNPLYGPRVRSLIEQLENGELPQKQSFVEETVFDCSTIKQEDIENRAY